MCARTKHNIHNLPRFGYEDELFKSPTGGASVALCRSTFLLESPEYAECELPELVGNGPAG